MEVLVTFESVMCCNNNGYLLFPEVMTMDSDFAGKVNEIGKRSAFVIYNIYLTDLQKETVSFIENTFRGSFVFIFSEVLHRWCLVTPFSKESWKSEHLIVTDENAKEELARLHRENDDGSTIVVPCIQTNDIQ